jgi:hypothetical protein
MRMLKVMLGLLVLFAVAGTANAQTVTTDHDPNANFSQYKTFMWINRPHVPADPLMEQRIIDSVSAALTAKGWRQVSEGADVGVSAHAATKEEHTLETFYDGFGGGWGWHRWGGGLGEAITTPQTYTVGTLVIDLFDTHTKQLIWRGAATATLSNKPDKDTKKLDKAVDKLFKDFPPHSS